MKIGRNERSEEYVSITWCIEKARYWTISEGIECSFNGKRLSHQREVQS